MKEITGSSIFTPKVENDATEGDGANPTPKPGIHMYQLAIAGISHISFGDEEGVSLKKPTTIPEVEKQRELSRTLEIVSILDVVDTTLKLEAYSRGTPGALAELELCNIQRLDIGMMFTEESPHNDPRCPRTAAADDVQIIQGGEEFIVDERHRLGSRLSTKKEKRGVIVDGHDQAVQEKQVELALQFRQETETETQWKAKGKKKKRKKWSGKSKSKVEKQKQGINIPPE
ncbi:hypothetical protein ACFX1S_014749 [Malus domestica]